ncbi:hypothetical protein [Streptomyces daqingensis]|nr:hypothetical protein [Streptomyces daqingensis]
MTERSARHHKPSRPPFSSFPTHLESAESNLNFEAIFTYSWRCSTDQGALLHGDEVARTLLRDAAAEVTGRYNLLLIKEAQDAVNSRLSEEIDSDPRLVVSGRVQLSASEQMLASAHQRAVAARDLQVSEAAETARLEVLRERLLDKRLGPVWWIDRFADLQFSTGDPASKAESVLQAFHLMVGVIRTEAAQVQTDEISVVRARVNELLSSLEAPETRKRAADLLETVIHTLAPEGGSKAAVDLHDGRQGG